MQRMPYNQQICMIKMASGHIAVAHKLYQWKQKKDNHCPFCQQVESVDHIFQCQDARAKEYLEKQINLFITHLKSRRTDPTITTAIRRHLTNWCNQVNMLPDGATPLWYAVTEQTSIGWRQFLCGKISHKWIERQSVYWKKRKINKSSFMWSIEMIRRIWKVAWNIWTFRCDFAYSPDSLWETQTKQDLQTKI